VGSEPRAQSQSTSEQSPAAGSVDGQIQQPPDTAVTNNEFGLDPDKTNLQQLQTSHTSTSEPAAASMEPADIPTDTLNKTSATPPPAATSSRGNSRTGDHDNDSAGTATDTTINNDSKPGFINSTAQSSAEAAEAFAPRAAAEQSLASGSGAGTSPALAAGIIVHQSSGGWG